ncbi:hypothetical protein NH340_JMT09315 [Sarcoptes scabiei]|uniref:DUF1448 domain containing protein n=1 Tax=Sarcoptes scabiei TaxID=52283 RepID=A0A132AMT7_SARSC|nr:DUF1448 domain containing protein [Sarcoptes scabiei]UXI23372.1 hypothetical protein NH340_JMT09315 [Sarcoptes scabiei]
MQKTKYDHLWQDRDIRFDASSAELSLRNGEKIIASWDRVEDTKGNTGEIGKLDLTNLRIMWQSINKPRINLTIGFNCIQTLTNRMIHTKLRGKNEALYLMTKINGTRYEFIFICLDSNALISKQIVNTISKISKAYVQTRLFRDLRLRSAIISVENKQLKMLATEQIYNVIQGVWNLSSDQGNLGTMYLSNIRVVWHANINELFNISIPYIQIRDIKVRDSKFGLALVIESSESSGGYVLGFRIDPVEKLNNVYEELNNLHSVHVSSPQFGIDHLETATELDDLSIKSPDSDQYTMNAGVHSMANYQEIMENDHSTRNQNSNDPFIAYLAEGECSEFRPHQWNYDPSIGLSIETIKDGFTMESLWEVVTSHDSK